MSDKKQPDREVVTQIVKLLHDGERVTFMLSERQVLRDFSTHGPPAINDGVSSMHVFTGTHEEILAWMRERKETGVTPDQDGVVEGDNAFFGGKPVQ